MRQRKIKNLQEKLEALQHTLFVIQRAVKALQERFFRKSSRCIWKSAAARGSLSPAVRRLTRNGISLAVEGNESVVLRALEKAAEQKAENIASFWITSMIWAICLHRESFPVFFSISAIRGQKTGMPSGG